MPQVFLYARVSHKNSADSGISVANQIEIGQEYITTVIPQHPLFQNEPLVDAGVSGWNQPFALRPAGRVIAEEAQAGDHVVVYSIDRFARNLRDFVNATNYWMRNGIFVHYIADNINTTTAVGRFQAHIKAAMAQYASDILSERIREAFAIKRMQRGEAPNLRSKKVKWEDSAYGLVLPEGLSRKTGTIHMYERVSSNQQYTSGLGLEHQSVANEKAAQRLAKALGSKVGDVYSDPAVSAFKLKFHERPAGKRLLDTVKPGDDIVIYRSDRAWRHPGDAVDMVEELRKREVYVHLVNEGIRTDTQQGMEWIGVFAAMGHLESSMRSRRTKAAMTRLKANGRCVGTIPAGFRIKRLRNGHQKLVIDHDAMRRLAAIWIMKHEMELTSTAIMDVLNAWAARETGKPANLLNRVKHHMNQLMDQASQCKQRVGNSIWEKALDGARKYSFQPIEEKYWRLSRQECPFGLAREPQGAA